MNEKNQRFKDVRLACEKSQEEWGKILGLTKSGVSDIERGKRNVTDQHLLMLSNWKERHINIDYIREGKGSIFKTLNRSQQIAEFTEMLFKEEEDSFKSRFLLAFADLDAEEWEVLRKLAEKAVNKKD